MTAIVAVYVVHVSKRCKYNGGWDKGHDALSEAFAGDNFYMWLL